MHHPYMATHPHLTTTVQVRMAPRTKRTLTRLAKHYERTPSEVLRRLIDDEAARLDAVTQPNKQET
jgi:predicted transcriptional regulator